MRKCWSAGGGWLFLLAGLCFLSGACSGAKNSAPEPEEPTGPPWFIDVTEEVGLDFVHDAGGERRHSMPQIVGSGAALFDFDGDGLLDIYLIQNGGPRREEQTISPTAGRQIQGRQRRFRAGRGGLRHGRRHRRRQQRWPTRRPPHSVWQHSPVPQQEHLGPTVIPRHNSGSRSGKSPVGNLGLLLRLQSRWLARPGCRQLR